VTSIRIVLVGRADMLQDIIKRVLDEDPALQLIGEAETVADLPLLWDDAEPDVVVIRPLSADVPAAVFRVGPGAQVPAVLGVDPRGTRGVVVLEDLSRSGLGAAIHAAAALRDGQEAR
jgi:DNA-binding NarL/FixJ family response regulator